MRHEAQGPSARRPVGHSSFAKLAPSPPRARTLEGMNVKRWWCAITTHRWRRDRQAGTDMLTCKRCGYITSLQDESRTARHWDSSYGG